MNIIFDTCFWYALYDEKDQYHTQALHIVDKYLNKQHKLVIPFPSLYETLNTEFAKQEKWMIAFNKLLSNNTKVFIIHDDKYREEAFKSTFITVRRHLSLVDTIIRMMIDDPNNKIGALVSFNIGDFEDVCRKRQIELIFN